MNKELTMDDFQKSETWTKSWKRENVVSESQKWSKSLSVLYMGSRQE
jgi:hypothetical protein